MYITRISIFFLFIAPFFAYSQQAQLSGTVYQQDSVTVFVGASVSLLSTENNRAVRSQQSGEQGKFLLNNVPKGTYTLQISALGYQTYSKADVKISGNETLNLGKIALVEQGEELAEILVQGKLPDLQIGIDKKVFDVSQSLVSVGGSAQDVLANVPTLQLQSDGSISLRGSTNVRILIDGKESAMAGSDINAFLQSLPGDAISKVEIMTNPSAKHDAEGQSGIVNIILKKNIRTGLNGSVNVSAGTYENAQAGVTLNYRPGKVNYFGSYNFSKRNMVGEGFTDNTDFINGMVQPTSPRTRNEEESTRKGDNHTIRLGTDYYATEKTTLSLAGNLSLRSNNRTQDFNYFYWNLPGYGATGFRNSKQLEDDLGIDVQFDFKHGFKREGEEIMANVSFGNDTEDGTNNFFQEYASGKANLNRRNTTSEAGRNWNFQLDYTLPLGEEHKFEAGYRSIIRNSEDTQFSLLDSIGGPLLPDYNVSNNFDMESLVHALYVNYQKKLTEKFGVQVGLRAEQANLNSTYYGLNPSNPTKTDGKLDYFRLYPSLFLSYDVGDGQSDKVQLSYTRRVERPRGWQVNPFIDMSNEQSYMQGNPNLMPQDIHALELGFSKFYDNWNFVSSVYYRRSNDVSQPFIYPDSLIADIVGDRSNITYSRWENVADNNAMGFELISKVNLFNWWDVTANANMFYNQMNPKAAFDVKPVSNFNWHGNLSTNLKMTPTFSAQIRGDYRSGMRSLQGKMDPMMGVDLALKKDLLNNKANLTLNVRDVFNSRKFEMSNILPDRQVNFSHRWMKRMVNLSFTYRFGIQDRSKKNREENMDMGDMGGQQF